MRIIAKFGKIVKNEGVKRKTHNIVSYDQRYFLYFAPPIWNTLPQQVHSSDSVSTFTFSVLPIKKRLDSLFICVFSAISCVDGERVLCSWSMFCNCNNVL